MQRCRSAFLMAPNLPHSSHLATVPALPSLAPRSSLLHRGLTHFHVCLHPLRLASSSLSSSALSYPQQGHCSASAVGDFFPFAAAAAAASASFAVS